jgi:hypothetical protein
VALRARLRDCCSVHIGGPNWGSKMGVAGKKADF